MTVQCPSCRHCGSTATKFYVHNQHVGSYCTACRARPTKRLWFSRGEFSRAQLASIEPLGVDELFIQEYLDHLLSKYTAEPRAYIEGDDLEYLRRLIPTHPRAEEKIGPGVRAVFVATSPDLQKGHKTYRCFWVERVDGTSIDVGRKHFCTRRSAKNDVTVAMRHAVQEQVFAVKGLAEFLRCRSCDTGSDVEIDHVKPFGLLRDAWLESEGLTYSAVDSQLITGQRASYVMVWQDGPLLRRWQAFHQRHAVYQPLCRSCHQLRTQQQRSP